jgi:hypothetical protein
VSTNIEEKSWLRTLLAAFDVQTVKIRPLVVFAKGLQVRVKALGAIHFYLTMFYGFVSCLGLFVHKPIPNPMPFFVGASGGHFMRGWTGGDGR